MKKIIFCTFLLTLLATLAPAQKFQPHFYAGLSLPRNSFTPSTEIPARKYNPGYTLGANFAFVNENSSGAAFLGINYTQKGGKLEYMDGTKKVTRTYTTRFNAIGLEFGDMLKREDALFNVIHGGASITAAYILGGHQDFTDSTGLTITRKLSSGKEAPDDLFFLSIGFKVHLMFNLGDHFDLRLSYQGSFNELDLINKNNLRDKGLLITFGYWIHPREQ
jgi:Outer membrane protein beta-barrel domain